MGNQPFITAREIQFLSKMAAEWDYLVREIGDDPTLDTYLNIGRAKPLCHICGARKVACLSLDFTRRRYVDGVLEQKQVSGFTSYDNCLFYRILDDQCEATGPYAEYCRITNDIRWKVEHRNHLNSQQILLRWKNSAIKCAEFLRNILNDFGEGKLPY